MALSARMRRSRRLVLGGAAACAVLAVFGGLARIGWHVPARPAQVIEHGPLFVLGVFVTVISLERAVALGVTWAYAVPALSGLGGLGLLVPQAARPAQLGLALAALGLVAINVVIVRRQRAAFTVLMLLGSLVLAAGVVVWARGAPVFVVAPAWIAFFVLTIVGERLEMSRLVRRPRHATPLVLAASAVVAIASLIALRRPVPTLCGVGLVAIAAWQLRYDAAWRTLRTRGLPRYAATGILLGAGWLAVSGLAMIVRGLPVAGPDYDAALHAAFVGFALSAVLAHAPIIAPAVARIAIPFHRGLYLPLVVLHASLAARVAGDWTASVALRRGGALGTAIALGLVPIVVIAGRRLAARRHRLTGLASAAVVLGLGAGCVRVAPYQRGHLAPRIMEATPWPALDAHAAHVHEVREGTGGATGAASGGCGCN